MSAPRSRARQRLRHVVFATLAFTAGVCVRGAAATDTSEQLRKAGYVYNFARLVEWPEREGQPIVIGVFGDDDFATALSGLVAQTTPDDRTYLVKPVRSLAACGCRILFLAGAHRAAGADVIWLQNSASVLTIGEAPDFARRGGIVAMTMRGGKPRLAVNVDAAARASVTISSRLLGLATIVRSGR